MIYSDDFCAHEGDIHPMMAMLIKNHFSDNITEHDREFCRRQKEVAEKRMKEWEKKNED